MDTGYSRVNRSWQSDKSLGHSSPCVNLSRLSSMSETFLDVRENVSRLKVHIEINAMSMT